MMKDTQDTIRFILPDGTRFRLTRTRLYVKRSRRIARNRGQLPFAHGASGESYFLNHISWELTGQRIILRTRGGSKIRMERSGDPPQYGAYVHRCPA